MGKDIVDKLTEAAIETRQLLRDVHSVMKELKRTINEAKQERLRIEETVQTITRQQIEDAVARGLAEYEEALSDSIKRADERVMNRFDKLADILLGEDKKSQSKGEPTLMELARTRRNMISDND